MYGTLSRWSLQIELNPALVCFAVLSETHSATKCSNKYPAPEQALAGD
jgi:hypothetical protein